MKSKLLNQFIFALGVTWISSLPMVEAAIKGAVSGVIEDELGVALPQAQVLLLDLAGKPVSQMKSSATGTFEFIDVNLGDYQILVQSPGFEEYRSTIHVSSGASFPSEIKLNPEKKTGETSSEKEMLVEVKAKKRLIQNASAVSRTEIQQEQINVLPKGNEASLTSLVSSTTPGVSQGAFGQLFIRGSHANIQYRIDEVQMPDSPSNTFGPAFSTRNIERLEVITGGIPAEYGQRLSAIFNIVTKSGPETPNGEIQLNYGSYNTVSPHILYGGSNPKGDLHYYFGLNFSRTDRGLDTPQPVSINNLNQGGTESVHNQAHSNSEFAKVDWQVNNENKLSFVMSHSYNFYQIPNYPSSFTSSSPYFKSSFQTPFEGGSNHLDGHDHHHDHRDHGHQGHSHSDKSDLKGANHHGGGAGDGPTFTYVPSQTNDTQAERNAYFQTIWKHTFNEKSFLQLAPYYKFSQVIVTNDPVNDLASGTPGNPNYIEGSNPSSFAQNRHVNNLGLKGDYTQRVGDSHLFKTGFQVQGSQSDGALSIQQGSLNNPVNSDTVHGTGFYEAVYIQDDFTVAKPLVFNLGLRFDAAQFRFGGDRSDESMLQPRLGLNYMVTETTKLHLFYGKLFQPAALENLRKTFGYYKNGIQSYDIKAQRDDYYEAGISQQVSDRQVVSLNAYYRKSKNIFDEAQLFRTSLAQPYNFAEGYAYGAELSIRGQLTADWSEYANYSYVIARGRGISGGLWALNEAPSNSNYQMLDHVQVHTANAGLTYAKNYFWWTTQGVYGSGLRTGEDNDVSLPSHFTFDTTVGYQFHGSSWFSQFKLSGDVLNIFDNRYPITVANAYNGSHYAAGRQFFIRLTKMF